MKLYNFPIKYNLKKEPTEFQPIDLDYIVSIGIVFPVTYTGNSLSESHAYFEIYIKIGQPILVTHYSGHMQKCPDELINVLNKERIKLINAWENKDVKITQ